MNPPPANPAALLPTPRTEKALKGTQGLFRIAAAHHGFADFARTLERELAGLDKDYGNLLAENNELAARFAPPQPVDVAETVERLRQFRDFLTAEEIHDNSKLLTDTLGLIERLAGRTKVSEDRREEFATRLAAAEAALTASKAEVERLATEINDYESVIHHHTGDEGDEHGTVVLIRCIESLKAQLATRSGESARDTERMDWLCDFIQRKGSRGIEEMDWHLKNDDPMEEPELLFDREAIDNAIEDAARQTGATGKERVTG